MSNRLKDQSSPYLLQHAENPVDWYPWGDEAFEKALGEDKPVFLSIGYSTCHWCHVMAHESFEDPEIAGILNQYFVSVKVDREERPDIDSVYMEVCQALTGSGGWPMSIFMTAGQKPFFAGTYFPARARYGAVGFSDLLLAIARQWKSGRSDLLRSAEQILSHIQSPKDTEKSSLSWEHGRNLPDEAAKQFSQSFDPAHGGFGRAPKFPTPHNLIFLTLYARVRQDGAAMAQVLTTLDKMRRGGIFDQIGYGFSRYSTDPYFLVPHFEKMLYDNALLILAYSAAAKAKNSRELLDTAEKTADYIFREMTGAEGEFYSAQDADSGGEEGKYYVWSREEICQVLGDERDAKFCAYFGITEEGNFEGRNIPNLLNGNSLRDGFDKEKKALYDYRKCREALHLDDKVLTAWNALMICALSVLYRATGSKRYLQAAERAHQFIEQNLSEGSRLYVSCRNKVRSVKGFLDDYAFYTAALLCLYEASGKSLYLERAEQICGEARSQFEAEEGGFYLYGHQNSPLITRPKESYDGALPSGNSVMAYCLVRLSQLTGDSGSSAGAGAGGSRKRADGPENHAGADTGDCLAKTADRKRDYRQAAEKQLRFMAGEAGQYPMGYSLFLTAWLLYENPPQEITVVLSKEDSPEEILASLPLCSNVKIYVDNVENARITESVNCVKNVDNFSGSRGKASPRISEKISPDRETPDSSTFERLPPCPDGYTLLNGKTTYYVCKNHTCYPPSNQIPG